MEVVFPMTYLDNCKRYWRRRRKYQRLNSIIDDQTNNCNSRSSYTKKIRISRLGRTKAIRGFRLRLAPKLVVVSPMLIKRYLAKFYDAYIDRMIASLVGRKRVVGGSSNISSAGLKSSNSKHDQMICGTNHEVVDARLVLEIYKRIVASREVAA